MTSVIKPLIFDKSRKFCCTVKTKWFTAYRYSDTQIQCKVLQMGFTGAAQCDGSPSVSVHVVCSERRLQRSRNATQRSLPETPWVSCMAGLEWIWGHWVFRNLLLLPKSLTTPHSVMWHLKWGHCPQLMSRVAKDPHSHLNFHWVPGAMPQGIFSNSGGATCYLRRENEPLAIRGKNKFILNES